MCNIPFILTLTSFQIQEKVTKNLVFLHTLYKMGGTLCARLSPNRFTYLHILGAKRLYNHCRCTTYLSFWSWLYFRSRTRSRKTLFSCILYIRQVVLCVRDSAQTASHICTYLVPIKYNRCRCATYLSLWPWLYLRSRRSQKFSFLHTLYKTGGTLCARLSPNRFTYLHILGANQLYNHCRCAPYLSFWPWFYFRSRSRSHKTLFSCIHVLYIRRVVLCVCDSAQTASHICTHLVPINCTIMSFWPWPHFRSRTRSQKLSFFCMLYLNNNDWQLCHFLHVNFTFP